VSTLVPIQPQVEHVVIPAERTVEQVGTEQVGTASWYGPKFHGKKTANGEIFNQNNLTAASRTLPLGSEAVVTNLETGESVKVKINDRGPYARGRVIDLSRAAAREIGIVEGGIAKVKIKATPPRKSSAKKSTPLRQSRKSTRSAK
jgi:rare lipoprotein A